MIMQEPDSNRGGNPRRYFLSAIALGFALGFASLFLPVPALVAELFGWLFLLTAAAGVAAAARAEARPKATILALGCFAFCMAVLPLALAAIGSADHRSPVLIAIPLVLCLSPLCALAFALRPNRGFDEKSASEVRRPLSLLLALVAFALSLAALALAFRTVSAPESGIFGVLMPQFIPYFAFSFLAIGASAVVAARRSGILRRLSWAFALPALAAFALGIAPLADTPFVIAAGSAAFKASFGVDARSIESAGMKASPFSLGEFFLGSKPKAAEFSKDVVYLKDRARNGRDYDFKFDAWRPAKSGSYPVLIRIHGGAWVSGNKGPMNMGGMNRYFASLGYAVFDIQYGLSDKGSFSLKGASEPTEGPFGVDDMVRQIGAFSSYLVDHAAELGADTSRTFVSGGSAGGHLALAAVLATSSGRIQARPGIGLDPRLRVIGLIPFYPAVGIAGNLGVPGSADLIDPTPLLSAAAPPALVYQGRNDGMVPIAKVQGFRDRWRAVGGPAFAMVEFPFAGHGSDLIFDGPYNQVFVYFMERFMELERR